MVSVSFAQSPLMNVLHIATLNRPIRKDMGYGPIETIVYNIDKGLRDLGHRSIVACSGDSLVAGEHFPTIPKSFREYLVEDTPEHRETMRKHLAMSLERAGRGDIDIIHLHDAVMTRHIFEGNIELPVPVVMTLHVPAEDEADFKRWNASLVTSSAAYFVPISEFQAQEHQGLINLQQVVHHGVDVDDFPFERALRQRDYLFSIGRITRDKGQDIAICVARASGDRLVIAGNVQNKAKDRAFYEELKTSIDLTANGNSTLTGDEYYLKVMKPILDSDARIIYLGEVNSAQKKMWYQHARATLFPIQWGEPFGLVLIESMACGTPVIALHKGSVPEIVVHEQTGFVVDSAEEMIGCVKELDRIVRADCRSHIKKNFSIAEMTRKYAALYRRITECSQIA